jgi:hypothetical protein
VNHCAGANDNRQTGAEWDAQLDAEIEEELDADADRQLRRTRAGGLRLAVEGNHEPEEPAETGFGEADTAAAMSDNAPDIPGAAPDNSIRPGGLARAMQVTAEQWKRREQLAERWIRFATDTHGPGRAS